jgi:hypothetical protein
MNPFFITSRHLCMGNKVIRKILHIFKGFTQFAYKYLDKANHFFIIL